MAWPSTRYLSSRSLWVGKSYSSGVAKSWAKLMWTSSRQARRTTNQADAKGRRLQRAEQRTRDPKYVIVCRLGLHCRSFYCACVLPGTVSVDSAFASTVRARFVNACGICVILHTLQSLQRSRSLTAKTRCCGLLWAAVEWQMGSCSDRQGTMSCSRRSPLKGY